MAVTICPNCDLPRGDDNDAHVEHNCVAAQSLAMKQLLNNVGQQALCRGCSKPGYWVSHYNGKATFYTPAGLNHFVDCPVADRFKKGKR